MSPSRIPGVQPAHRQTRLRPPAPQRNQGAGRTADAAGPCRTASQGRGDRAPRTDAVQEGDRAQGQPDPAVQAG